MHSSRLCSGMWLLGYLSLLIVLVPAVQAIPILRNAKVVLNCAGATGTMSCDWLCYDACVSSHSSAYLTAEQMEDCLSVVLKGCSIPATAHNMVHISDFCSIDPQENVNEESPAEDVPVDQYTQRNPGYLFTIPKISNQNWKWNIESSKIKGTSIDIDGDFDSEYCLAPSSYKITTTEAAVIPNAKNICNDETYHIDIKKLEASSDTEQYDTTTSFGFKKLNVNFTQWAQDYETKIDALGTKPINVHLSSINTCWASATSMTMYYTVDFTIKTEEPNSGVFRFQHATAASLIPLLSILAILS